MRITAGHVSLKPWVHGFLIRLLLYPALAYLVLGAGLYLQQDRLLFPAPAHYQKADPHDRHIDFEDLRIAVGKASYLHGWWIPSVRADGPRRAVLVFHGNGYVIEEMVWSDLTELRALGADLLLVDYRGYGSSTPIRPREATVQEDARAALRYLLVNRHMPLCDVFVLGRSIGSGPATDLAEQNPGIAGLILESPFTSIDDAAARVPAIRIFPVGLLLRSHFDNLSKIGSVRTRLLIVSGTDDTLTPVWMARKIFERARGPKQLYLVPGAGHDDLLTIGGDTLTGALRTFIRRQP